MRFVITSGTCLREIVDQRADATAAYQRVMDLVSTKRPDVRIFDEDGQTVSMDKLRRLARGEKCNGGCQNRGEGKWRQALARCESGAAVLNIDSFRRTRATCIAATAAGPGTPASAFGRTQCGGDARPAPDRPCQSYRAKL